MAVELGSAVGKIEIDTSGVTRGIQAAGESLRGAERSLATIGGSATRAGAGLMTLGAPLAAFGAGAAKVAGDFESQMNILAVAAQGGSTSIENLRDVALQAGTDITLIGVSADDVAGAMTNFAKAGLDTNAMLGDMNGYLAGTAPLGGALRAAVDLAAASELDLAQASELVVTTMSTFGISAEDASAAMNNYVQSADASVASVSDLAAAMQNIGPTMAAFGIPLEDVNTALAVLSTRGITGAEAGTALKSMMTNIMRDSPEAAAALEALNVSLYDEAGAMRSLPNIIADLSSALSGMTDEERNAAVQTLAGSYGMKAMNTLLAEGEAGWNDMAAAISAGATMQATAAARTQGFNASMEQLKDAVQTFLIEAGTPLIRDVLTPLVRTLSEVVGRLADMDPAFLKAVVVVGAVVTALGGLLVVFGQIATAVSAIGALFGAGGVLAGIGAALGPILLVIAAIVAAVLLFKQAWESNFLGIRDIVQQVGMAIGAVFDFVKGVFAGFLAFLRGDITLEEFLAHVTDIFGDLRDALSEILPNIEAGLTAAWDRIREVVGRALELIRYLIIEGVSRFIAPLVGGVENAREIVTRAWENIAEAVSNVWAWLANMAGNAWETIKNIVTTAIETVRTVLATALALISGDWSGAWEALRDGAARVWEGIKATLGAVWEGIRTAAATAWAGIRSAVTEAWEQIRAAAGPAWERIKENVVASTDVIRDQVSAAWETVRTRAGEAWEGVRERITPILIGIRDFVVNTLGEIATAAGNLFGQIIAAVSGRAGEGGSPLGALLNVPQLRATVEEAVAAIRDLQVRTSAIGAQMQAWWTAWRMTEATATQAWTALLLATVTAAWTAVQTATTTIWTAVQTWWDAWRATEDAAFRVWLAGLVTAVTAAWVRMLANTRTQFEAMRAAAVAATNALRNQVMEILDGLAGDARAAGEAVGNGVADGIYASIPAAVAAAEALAAAVRARLPSSDAETGPLSDLTASGRALPETLARGMLGNLAAVAGAANTLAAAMLPAFGAGGGGYGMAAFAGMPGGGRGYPAPTGAGGRPQAAPITVNLNVARVGDDVDVEVMAYRIAEVLQWRTR